ncbi:TetR/AcrR family transcriptional regulator [Niallia taxi]|uniref:TetR/AcrR family transcriptional regulator n=1 Tax=Niallia taxi TaxID=2499688 RepID=UPI003D2E5722
MSSKNEYLDKRILKSKKALKAAFLLLMQEKNFKDITITDIVQTADLNRGTFYKHYAYKEELLNEIMDDVMTDFIASYREPYKNSETFEVSKLTSNAIKVFDHVQKHASFYKLIIHSEIFARFPYKLCNVLKELSIQDLHVHENDAHIDRELAASYSAYAIYGMIIEWIEAGFKYSSSYMAEQLLLIINRNTTVGVFKPSIETP